MYLLYWLCLVTLLALVTRIGLLSAIFVSIGYLTTIPVRALDLPMAPVQLPIRSVLVHTGPG